jgi:hypothetical protein
MPDLKPRELWAVGPLIALIIVLGVYPKPVLNIINPAVHSTLVGTHSTDPVPPHPAQPVSPVSTTSLVHHVWVPDLGQATRLTQPALTQPALTQPVLTQPVLTPVLKQGSSG